jgi:hypothetical protein
MRAVENNPERLDYFRSNEFSGLDNRSAMDDAATPQSPGNVEGKPVEKDSVNQEQEQQLETWMSEIKAFIRNIDISKL